jgi:hypothetical protein
MVPERRLRKMETMSTTLTFDEMERSADRTLAVALWARHVSGLISCITLFAILHTALRGLLRSLRSGERLSALTDREAGELADKLRELHLHLAYVLEVRGMHTLRTKPIFASLIASLEEDTEDLYDIIENLVLSTSKEFRSLISDCIQSSSSVERAEPVGQLHG